MSGALAHSGTCIPGSHNSPRGPVTIAFEAKSARESERSTGKMAIEESSFGPPGFSCFTG
jgi:hypothetical protein